MGHEGRLILVSLFVVSIALAATSHPRYMVVTVAIIIIGAYIINRPIREMYTIVPSSSTTREKYTTLKTKSYPVASRVQTSRNYSLDNKRDIDPQFASCAQKDRTRVWVDDEVTIDVDGEQKFFSRNQALVGSKVHPRTLVAPVITPPSHDQSYWRKDEFNRFPLAVNRPRYQDLYLSGYVGGTCGYEASCGDTVYPNIVKENFGTDYDTPSVEKAYPPKYDMYSSSGGQELKIRPKATRVEEVASKLAREQSFDPSPTGYVNGEYIDNIVTGGYRDPFRATCGVPVTNPAFTNPEIKSPCNWNCASSVPSFPEHQQMDYLSNIHPTTPEKVVFANVKDKRPIEFLPVREDYVDMNTEPSSVALNQPTLSPRSAPYSSDETTIDQSPKYPYYDSVVKEKTIPGNNLDTGFVNTACAYDPRAFEKYGVQVNKCLSPGEEQDAEYNKNKAVQIVQPGMYYESAVLDPISANIGISHQQQFQPQTAQNIAPGQTMYTDHNALEYAGETYENQSLTGEELQNIYDPRHTGYASNDRYYVDKLTGQPRFFYDDIDGVKRPSYIVRSNVDHLGQFDQTGAMKHGKIEGDYRVTANREFAESTLDMRSDIQTRLAQMRYARTQQLRDMPLSAARR
jgi:hypothetical protein